LNNTQLRWLVVIGAAVVMALGLVLLFLLTQASDNQALYEENYQQLFALNVVVASLLLSFTDFDIYALGRLDRLRFIGLENYRRLLNDPMFWTALKNTFYFVIVGGPLSVLVSLGAALLAGLSQGVFSSPDELRTRLAIERVFEPQCSRDQAEAKMAAWEAPVHTHPAAQTNPHPQP